ncbi:MAG: acyltransferase [Prevotella sp.]|nr:acyltransferase [Prevotella sp.]
MKVFKTNSCAEQAHNIAVSLRDNTLDIVAGILIIRMILGHYMVMCKLQDTLLFESLNILFFYMPWFFFKSGMFCSAERKEPKKFLGTNIKKFMLPFLVFSVIGTILAIIPAFVSDYSNTTILSTIKGELTTFVRHGSTGWNSPLWFLISLCLVRVVFNYIRNFINHYVIIGMLMAFAFFHYLYLADKGLWWGGNFSRGMIFYILGMKLKDLQYNKIVFVISLIIVIAVGVIKPTIVTMFGNFLLFDDGIYLLWYPFCLAGIIVFNNLIKFTGKFLNHYHFDDMGSNSMIYYVIHYPLGFLLCSAYNHFAPNPNNWELFMYLCLMWLGMLPLITYIFNTKRLSFLIGK